MLTGFNIDDIEYRWYDWNDVCCPGEKGDKGICSSDHLLSARMIVLDSSTRLFPTEAVELRMVIEHSRFRRHTTLCITCAERVSKSTVIQQYAMV